MLPKIMQNFLIRLGQEKRSDLTISAYEINLKDFVEYFFSGEEFTMDKLLTLTTDDFMEWIDSRKEKIAVSGLNQRIATLRKFYTYLIGLKLTTVNIPQMIGTIKEDELVQRPVLTEEEVRMLLDKSREVAELKSNYEGYRNEMMVNLFVGTGLRIQELHDISIGDINIETGEFIVKGKRGKKRIIVLNRKLLVLYEGYIKVRGLQKHSNDSALFLSRQKSENGYRLSIDQIRRVVVTLAKQSGVKTITPHSLRHTNATLLIKKGVDIMDVSKHLGHSSTAITEKIYVHQTNMSAVRVAEALDIF